LDVYRKSNDNVTGQPIYFALVDDSIEFAPTPDGSYTVQLTYYGKIDALSDSNTSNFLSTRISRCLPLRITKTRFYLFNGR